MLRLNLGSCLAPTCIMQREFTQAYVCCVTGNFRVDYYEIDVNDLRQFKHAFVDSFLQWQMFDMTFRKCNYYDFEYALPNYIHFFYDYLRYKYDIKTELAAIEKIRVTTANLASDDDITIGGDECWT